MKMRVLRRADVVLLQAWRVSRMDRSDLFNVNAGIVKTRAADR